MLKTRTVSVPSGGGAQAKPITARPTRRHPTAHPPAQRSGNITILIADREAIFRLGLQKLLAGEAALRVVAQAASLDEAAQLSARHQPDLLFLQAEMLGERAGDALAQARRDLRARKIVLTASDLDDAAALQAVKAGASGVILKSTDPALFVKCARRVMEGEVWLPKRQVAELVRETQSQRPIETLTPREKSVIGCLVLGWRNREIGQHLLISEQTVKNHLRSIYDKVGVSDRLELVLYAIHQHMELPSATPHP